MLIRTLARRAAAAATGGALVATGLLVGGPAPQAHAAPVNPEAAAAASWLAAQLDANGRFTTGFDAVGSTVDLGLSLVATDASPATLTRVTDGVKGVLETYVGTEAAPNPSKLAKAAALFQQTGADLTDVAGIDLEARLEANVDDTTGQLGATPDVYGQVWAVQVLDAIGSDEAAKATDTLIAQKCTGAGWGYTYEGVCTSAVDGTAYTLLALLPQRDDPDVAAAVTDAITWLKDQQRLDGGFGDWGVNDNGTTSEGNGTGLAAWALGAAGETESAERAATWVADHQVANLAGCTATVPGESGAIAYDDFNMNSAIEDGITSTDRGTWVFTGAQALAGLAYLPAGAPSLTGPTGYVHAGGTAGLGTLGLRTNQPACLSGIGAARKLSGPGQLQVAVPAGTRTYTATLTYVGGSKSVTVKALGAKKLTVKSAARAKARAKLTVKVTGLAAGERVTVKVGTKKVTGTATAAGKLTVKVKLAKKKGKTKVVAIGQFADRKGQKPLRVV
ncbi:prenyltransferase/squalene oxidase repeat-containing protein [Pimelobacter simplex]|uniref:prenyltransferase/squalene oxidase repeat-containing protein n=1 Tax=Nocardioides simplex TaxID=2045 RepID=UPI003AAF3395